MAVRNSRSDPPTPRPLANWSIAVGAVVVLAVAGVIGFVLLRRYGGQGAQVQLDAIRTAGTLVIGTSGAVALLLTARRQRYTELALLHTDRDATERRITELYTKAADQLGSEKAPVRLAGLYALERLAQNTPEQRQTIVDVICAYLRMPYTPPDEKSPFEYSSDEAQNFYENRRQEQQVRLTAQNILSRNLRILGRDRPRWWQHTPPPAVPAWPGIHLNLTGAVLVDFSVAQCQFYDADFRNAKFTGVTDFRRAKFIIGANFQGAQFTGDANFQGAQLPYNAYFGAAQFTGWASRTPGSTTLNSRVLSSLAARTSWVPGSSQPISGVSYSPAIPTLLPILPTWCTSAVPRSLAMPTSRVPGSTTLSSGVRSSRAWLTSGVPTPSTSTACPTSRMSTSPAKPTSRAHGWPRQPSRKASGRRAG